MGSSNTQKLTVNLVLIFTITQMSFLLIDTFHSGTTVWFLSNIPFYSANGNLKFQEKALHLEKASATFLYVSFIYSTMREARIIHFCHLDFCWISPAIHDPDLLYILVETSEISYNREHQDNCLQ